ncbi:MAG: putative integral membrane protein (TIGR00697 family) [Francisellaceae bacterium]|jgi:uncharacterized integral membrane protein (TIGR00697 family)
MVIKKYKALAYLCMFQFIVITSTNYLVQFPITIIALKTTLGSFSYPLIFLSTDLTIRILNQKVARKVIFIVMLPSLLISYAVGIIFLDGSFHGIQNLFIFNSFVARIALASFSAYIFGQLLDITIFNRLRKIQIWWLPPFSSTTIGVFFDSLIFFSVAFYHSSNTFMAHNWVEIGLVDTFFKFSVSAIFMLPLYRIILFRFIPEANQYQNKILL